MKTTLYKEMECAQCAFRMKGEPGCMKFGLTRDEINRRSWVVTRKHGSFQLDFDKQCPYAKQGWKNQTKKDNR